MVLSNLFRLLTTLFILVPAFSQETRDTTWGKVTIGSPIATGNGYYRVKVENQTPVDLFVRIEVSVWEKNYWKRKRVVGTVGRNNSTDFLTMYIGSGSGDKEPVAKLINVDRSRR